MLSIELFAIIDSLALFDQATLVSVKDEWFVLNAVLELELNSVIKLVDEFTFDLFLD